MFLCWAVVSFHALISEGLRQIIRKSMIATPEICLRLARFHTALTAAMITTITLCTGNTGFIFLCLAPVLLNYFTLSIRFSTVILFSVMTTIITADITGWSKKSFLIAKNVAVSPEGLIYALILVVMSYLGYKLSLQEKQSRNKANMLLNMATTDGLTGLINRREFNRRLSEEIARSKRHKSALTLALFDIDYFKKINDTYGHQAGDEVLKGIGELLTVNTRSCDISDRYGGEEFALILPETGQDDAYELLERIRAMVEESCFYVSSHTIQLTISVGLAQYDFMDSCAADLCERADKALYEAKKNGRNNVECAKFGLPKIDLTKIRAKQAEENQKKFKL